MSPKENGDFQARPTIENGVKRNYSAMLDHELAQKYVTSVKSIRKIKARLKLNRSSDQRRQIYQRHHIERVQTLQATLDILWAFVKETDPLIIRRVENEVDFIVTELSLRRDFQRLKKNKLGTWAGAIIAEAYRRVTGSSSLPFPKSLECVRVTKSRLKKILENEDYSLLPFLEAFERGELTSV
ncbi:MAG: hypothetical protein ACFFE8_10310 [Candidatus Heimdallarchaeota archaeon]